MTIQEIKRLESMFIVEMHAAERILRLIESGMEKIYRESKDYKRLVKKMGKVAADKIVKEYTHRVLTQEETYHVGKLLEECKKLHHYMDRLTAAATAVDQIDQEKGITYVDMFDALIHDSSLLAYRHAIMYNVRPEDEIKVDSALKALAKDHCISDEILKELCPF